MRTFSQLPTGSREYRYSVKEPEQVKGDWMTPPEGFVTPTTSVTEWMVYKAFALIFNNPIKYREAPFNGGPPDWTFQQPFLGGRFTPLGAVGDFIYWRTESGRRPLLVRVQTEHWHLFTTFQTQVRDFDQRGRLSDRVDVVDIFDYTFLHDPTGQAVIQQVKRALGMIEIADPLRAGVVRRNSRR
jgi:hypothetical protein